MIIELLNERHLKIVEIEQQQVASVPSGAGRGTVYAHAAYIPVSLLVAGSASPAVLEAAEMADAVATAMALSAPVALLRSQLELGYVAATRVHGAVDAALLASFAPL